MKAYWIIGAVGLGLLAGCTQTDQARMQQNVQGARQELRQGVNQAQKAAADAALEGKVKQYLQSRKGLDARAINVEAKNGAVILKGDVASPEQARLAEQATGEVEGVQSVMSQLTMRVPATGGTTTDVAPPGPPATHPAEGR
jgi:osmotically-inducible protein OsmY